MGSAAAALVIGDYGARPRGDLPALADAVMG
jgi:hypothetical protein